jgi:phage gp29-like protein
MAKNRKPKDQLTNTQVMPSYDEMTGIMLKESTSILADYVRQYIGVEGDAIFLNFDPVLRCKTYEWWAQYDLYWYLEQDPHVRSILNSSKVNVAGMNWMVKPYLKQGEKKPFATHQAQADFIQRMFEQMQSFPQHLFDLMDALGKGFAFSEIMWNNKDGYWVIDYLINRTQRRIQFDAQSRAPKIRTIANPFYGESIPEGKYIVHRCSDTWGNPFGDALDQSLYWNWLLKRTARKFWIRNLETGSAAIPIVQHEDNADQKIKDEAMNIAEQLHSGSFAHMPMSMKIVYPEFPAASANAESYERFDRVMNDEMTKCVKGQTLTTEGSSSSGHGSNAAGKIHKITEDQFDMFRAKGLACSINKYLVKYVIDYNFANVDGYPRFTFDVEEEENLVQASTVLVNLAKALPGFDIDIKDVNKKFGYTFTKKEKSEPVGPINQNPNGVNTNPDGTMTEFAQKIL